MSIKIWMKKAYPVTASETTPDEATPHSLLKWRNARADVLRKHDLKLEAGTIVDADGHSFSFNSSTCALCFHYLEEDMGYGNDCTDCPLQQSLGRPCYEPDARGISPYNMFYTFNDPEPMIAALEAVMREDGRED